MDNIHEELRRLLAEYQKKDPNLQELADKLSVSRETIERWLDSNNLPHRAIASVIVEFLERELETATT